MWNKHFSCLQYLKKLIYYKWFTIYGFFKRTAQNPLKLQFKRCILIRDAFRKHGIKWENSQVGRPPPPPQKKRKKILNTHVTSDFLNFCWLSRFGRSSKHWPICLIDMASHSFFLPYGQKSLIWDRPIILPLCSPEIGELLKPFQVLNMISEHGFSALFSSLFLFLVQTSFCGEVGFVISLKHLGKFFKHHGKI